MILYSIITVVSILLASFIGSQRPVYQSKGSQLTRQQLLNGLCLSGIFLILTALASLRLDVGNDYGKYVITFHEIYAGADESYVVTEAGFNFLVKAIYLISGGENYLLVFAVFAAATVFLFLRAMYEQSEDFALSFALFMLLGIYFRTFNTVRYYFALAAAIYSIRYVLKKEYVKFLLLVLLGAIFHKSVLLVIPLYLIASWHWKKWHMAVGILGCVCLVAFQDFWLKLALEIYPTYKDTIYLSQGTGIMASATGILRCVLVLFLSMLFYKETIAGNKKNEFYFRLNLLGLAIYTSGSFLPLVSRFAYFAVTAHILLVPGIVSGIRESKKKKIVTGAVIACGLVYFAYFLMTADKEGVMVLPYRSFLFDEKEWLNGSYIF